MCEGTWVQTDSLLVAAKAGGVAAVKSALALSDDIRIELSQREPGTGRTPLHLLAAQADQTDAIDAVLEAAGAAAAELVAVPDFEGGDTPLHVGAHCPMACYQLAAAAPGACLVRNKEGATPVDVAARHGSCEALNALLLACAGARGAASLAAIRRLIKAGAVPDTWAPNGQSSLMLAAAADAGDAVATLLAAGASPELQDAMGRTALMWAAGSDAVAALQALLDGGASVSARDRRGRAALDYAAAPAARAALQERVKALEAKAAAAEEALLAELEEEQERRASKKAKRRAKAKEKKKGGAAVGEAAQEPATEQPQQQQKAAAERVEEEEGEAEEGGDGAAPDAPQLPPGSDAKAAGGCTTDEDAGVVTLRPTSPEWRTVTKKEKDGKAAAPSGVRPPAPAHHRRSPSMGSVASASSAASHDSGSGGERAAGAPRRGAAAAVPRLPAPLQRKALISRSTSGGEEPAPLFAAVAREGAWKVALPAPAAVPNNSTWASIAAQGPGSRPNSRASGTPPPLTARAPSPPPAPAPAPRAPEPASEPLKQPTPEPLPPPAAAPEASPALTAAIEEIAALRTEVQHLRLRATAAELAHHRELAAVMRDAAAAVVKAADDERAACTVRFAALLQGNGAALAAAVPGLLAGAGIATACDLDLFLNTFANNSNPVDAKLNPLEGSAAAAPGAVTADALAAMGFPQPDVRGGGAPPKAVASAPKAVTPAPAPPGGNADGSSGGSLFSPLSTSPFSFEVGEHLRGEFIGNHSAFVVPATEPAATASPPRAGGAWSWASPGRT